MKDKDTAIIGGHEAVSFLDAAAAMLLQLRENADGLNEVDFAMTALVEARWRLSQLLEAAEEMGRVDD